MPAPAISRTLRRLAATALALPFPAAAQTALPAQLAARVDSLVSVTVADGETAGVSVAVANGDRVVYANGFGIGSTGPRTAAVERTVYRLGAITAQFTAAAVLQLVDDGRVSLDAPLARYLPDYEGPGRAVRVRYLLNHTSGIRDYTTLGDRWERSIGRDLPADSVVALFSSEPLDFPPGTGFRYDNSAYFLLGLIVERVSGERYADYVRRHLAEPLGLTSVRYCGTAPTKGGEGDPEADGYSVSGDRFVAATPVSMTQPFSAGALCAAAPDLARWPALLAAGRVIPAALYARMTTPDTLADGRVLDYGYGVGVRRFAGQRVVEHGGGINGFAGHLAYFPAARVTIAVLANTESFDARRLERQLARLLVPGAAPTDLPLGAAEERIYAGNYVLGAHLPVRVFVQREALFAQPQGQNAFRLLYQGNGVFAADFDPDATLTFEVTGARATGFTLRQGGETTVAKRSR